MTPTPPVTAVSTDAGATATDAPAVELGPSFRATAFAPGRYAVAIQLSRRGTHARNRVREGSTMSMVLELAADGTATACRGWDYAMFNDGPKVSTEDRFREQLGFRGTFRLNGGIAEAELNADDTVCARIGEYAKGVPRRSTAMKLRCVLAAPQGGPLAGTPVLLCDWQDATTPEVQALRLSDAAPRPWILLGSGHGVRIKVTGAPPTLIGEPPHLTLEPAPEPLGNDAWQHPF